MITFKEDQKVEDTKATCEKMKDYVLLNLLDLVKHIFFLLPLLRSCAIFNIGTIGLAITVLGNYSIYFFTLSIISHMAVFFCVPLPNNLDQKILSFMGTQQVHNSSRPAVNKLPSALLLSWKNLFVLSCNAGQQKAHSTITIIYIQLTRFLSTLVPLVLSSLTTVNTNTRNVGIISCTLMFCGIIFLSLSCKSSTSWLEVQQNQVEVEQMEDEQFGLKMEVEQMVEGNNTDIDNTAAAEKEETRKNIDAEDKPKEIKQAKQLKRNVFGPQLSIQIFKTMTESGQSLCSITDLGKYFS